MGMIIPHKPARRWILPAVVLLGAVCHASAAAGSAEEADEPPSRIVSTAPNLTEILFALGLGDRVVAVSDFCDFPPEAAALPRVGGFVDLSFEALVAARPDIVVLLESHAGVARRIDRLGIRTVLVNDESLDDILAAIRTIGVACGADARADALIERMRGRIDGIRERGREAAGGARPRVLLCFGRNTRGGELSSVYAATEDSLFGELVLLAGGRPVPEDAAILYPQLSVEGIHALDPDIVVELSGSGDPAFAREIAPPGGVLESLGAVRRGQWHLVTGEWAVRPGPRILRLAGELSDLLGAWREGAP